MSGRARSIRLLVALAAICGLARPLSGQRIEAFVPTASRVVVAAPGGEPSAAGVFLASAVLPGAGQYRLGAGRWVAYAAVEAWAWINWLDTRGEADELEKAYRDLAWSVARRISVGRRQDREFEYYERMSHFPESGTFDADPILDGIQPEEDPATYNGSVWELARAIYLPAGADSVPPSEAAIEAALDYYERNAIEPGFAWSWGTNQLEHEHFQSLIRQSDAAARAGTTLLGVVLVNHVVSAVDALFTARLRDDEGKPGGIRLRSENRVQPDGITPFVVLEIPVP